MLAKIVKDDQRTRARARTCDPERHPLEAPAVNLAEPRVVGLPDRRERRNVLPPKPPPGHFFDEGLAHERHVEVGREEPVLVLCHPFLVGPESFDPRPAMHLGGRREGVWCLVDSRRRRRRNE
jgi:hypothetical protein